MNCSNCQNEVGLNDKYCNNCGNALILGDDEALDYLNEIRQFAKDQEEAKGFEKFDDLDLNNPTGILKAQLRMMISIYRRLEKLENKENLKVAVRDFDMPFSSMIIFEFKVILLGFLFSLIFLCLAALTFGNFFGISISTLLSNTP